MEITERVVAVALMFGLDVDEVWRPPEVEVPGEVLEFVEMRSGGVVFVTGPSGSGKSLLLGKMVEELGERMGVILLEDEGDLPGVALVDGVGESVEEACGVLARAGLAEARVMIRPPDCLSEGERYRFRLARAMARAEKEEGRVAVVADEFGSMLDRVTAVNIARRAARWAREKGVLLEDEGDLPGVALVDGVGESVEEACGVLARAGLAEARVMIRPPDCLSEGERYRFRLARAMARAEKEEGRVAVVADEFGSTLDRITAGNIARRAARWAREKGVLLVVATGHDDLVGVMGAEVVVEREARRHGGTKAQRDRG